MRARVAVLALWAVVVVLGALASAQLPGLLTTSLSVPGSSSAGADSILVRHFDDNVEGSFTVVVPRPSASTARSVAAVARGRGLRVFQERVVGGVLYANLTGRAGLARAAARTPALRAALASAGVAGALVTGPPALQNDLTPVLAGDLRRGEWIALGAALALLVLTLGLCGALAVPLAVAVATVAGALGLVDLAARATTMVLYAPNVVELIGLGLAADYSLLTVHRHRAEVARDPRRALEAAMATAGRTVAWSATVVALGCAALLLAPVPLLRSLGLAAMAVPLSAALAALTLQPALLSLLGERGVRPVGPRGLFAADAERGIWARAARAVTVRPRAALAGALVLLGACASGLALFSVTPASTSAIPASMESARGLHLVSVRVGAGVPTPIVVVVDAGARGRVSATAESRAITALATTISRDPDVAGAAIGDRAPFVDPTHRYAQILAVARGAFGAPATRALVARVRADLARARFPAGTRLYLGGAPAQGVDFLDRIYGAFPWIVALALALAYLVLARAFGSLVAAPCRGPARPRLGRRGLRADRRSSSRAGVGPPAARHLPRRPDRGVGPGLPLRRALRSLHGLRGLHRRRACARRASARRRAARRDRRGLRDTGGVVTAAALIMVGALERTGLRPRGRPPGARRRTRPPGVLVDATIVRGLAACRASWRCWERNWWLPAGRRGSTRQRAASRTRGRSATTRDVVT